jgi:hypothetical protein
LCISVDFIFVMELILLLELVGPFKLVGLGPTASCFILALTAQFKLRITP